MFFSFFLFSLFVPWWVVVVVVVVVVFVSDTAAKRCVRPHRTECNVSGTLIYMWQNTWESDSRRPRHPRALDKQQPLAIKGPPKNSTQNWHSTSEWTECEKCRKMRQNPQHLHETLSMNESETSGTCRCVITATSAKAPVVAQQRARQQPFPSTAPVESRRVAAEFCTVSTHLCVTTGVSGTLTMNWIRAPGSRTTWTAATRAARSQGRQPPESP